MKTTVLFDFHNTLATCDRWLQLEIRLLPALALSRLAERGLIDAVPSGELERAESLFRELRQDVRESGIELSAFEGTERVLQRLGYQVPEQDLHEIVAELEEECLPEVRLVPGADRAVKALRAAGYTLGIVSSAGYPQFVHMALDALGLSESFSVVITSAGEGLYKSNPDLFRRALARLGSKPHLAVHIGDHAIYDVMVAKLAGLSVIWFAGQAEHTARLHGTAWEDALRAGQQADAVITEMDELYAAVLALDGC